MKPMLAKSYEGQNVKGWLMSEKLDGVRAIWTGEKLISRNGNEFFAPDWFKAKLPTGIALDGELYMGRGKFQQTVGIVRSKDADWYGIAFHVFDAPSIAGTFAERIEFCKSLQGITVVDHIECQGAAHMEGYFIELCRLGAEGIMLREPSSQYEQRRSHKLLKYKPIQSDEAELVEVEIKRGKLATLALKWRDRIIKVGTGFDDSIRTAPPAIGSLISFSYSGLTDSGIPRFPAFLAERSYE